MSFQKFVFQKKLLHWYRASKRDLPWRRTRDPYKILVSEIMLQQTQVDTVIPYYERWIKQFPDFKTLAAAEEATVLKSWQGLGYYRRAKMFHKNARQICATYNGKLPQSTEELIKLPGIGRYTAGAIASIAFNKKAPLLDGNVIRILTRLFAISKNVSEKETIEQLWEIAASLLPDKKVGDFNQALMELGATVCFPRSPHCGKCPVSHLCEGYRVGKPEDYPVKSPSIKTTKLNQFAFILWDKKKRVLVKKQKSGERWADLWTLPHFENLKKGLANLKIERSHLKKIRTDKHGFTRYQITLNTFALQGSFEYTVKEPAYQWMSRQEIKKNAFPAVYQKILNEVLGA